MAEVSSRTEIDRQWFAEVKEAQAHYLQALAHQQQTMDELDKALIEPADGSADQATRAAKSAFDELARCQEELVKLVLQQA